MMNELHTCPYCNVWLESFTEKEEMDYDIVDGVHIPFYETITIWKCPECGYVEE